MNFEHRFPIITALVGTVSTAAGWLGGVNELDEAIDYMELKAKHNGQWVAFSSDGKTKPSSIDEIVCTVRQHGKIISRYWNGTAWEWQRV